jgi:hypothetical protein
MNDLEKEDLLIQIKSLSADNLNVGQPDLESQKIDAYIAIKKYIMLCTSEKDVKDLQKVLSWCMHQHGGVSPESYQVEIHKKWPS